MLVVELSPRRKPRPLPQANTLPDEAMSKDARTSHEALRVHNGTKLVATTWIHAFGGGSRSLGCYPNPLAEATVAPRKGRARRAVVPRAVTPKSRSVQALPTPAPANLSAKVKTQGGYGWIPRVARAPAANEFT